jgi:integrase
MNSRFKFKKTILENLPLPAPNTRATYHDTGELGLQLRVASTAIKTFSYVYRHEGVQQRYTIGRFPDISVEQARDAVKRLKAKTTMGENPAAAKRQGKLHAQAELTLEQAFNRYHNDYLVPEGKRTANELRDEFARFFGHVPPGQKKLRGCEKTKAKGGVRWERRKLSSITPADVRRMMLSLKDGVGPRTANKALVMLKAIYNKMMAWHLYEGPNPCIDNSVKKFASGEQSRGRYLRGEELPRFFEALAAMDETFQDFVVLSLTTGARLQNVLSMRWGDLEIGHELKVWTIPGTESKNGEQMVIPLTGPAINILKRRKEAAPRDAVFVFPAARQAGHMSAPKRKWKALLEAARITDLRIHDLRRSLGSWQINTGASLAIVGKSLGHRSSSATMVYARLQVDPVRDAMERAWTAIAEQAGIAPNAEIVPLKSNVS